MASLHKVCLICVKLYLQFANKRLEKPCMLHKMLKIGDFQYREGYTNWSKLELGAGVFYRRPLAYRLLA